MLIISDNIYSALMSIIWLSKKTIFFSSFFPLFSHYQKKSMFFSKTFTSLFFLFPFFYHQLLGTYIYYLTLKNQKNKICFKN